METRAVTGPDPVVTDFELTCADHRPAEARTRLADCLDRHCGWANKPAVLLVASELLTNAIRHTPGAWTMRVIVHPARLVVEVCDQSGSEPAAREPDLTGQGGGMGMHIVAKLTSWHETEILSAGTGKTVRAVWQAPVPAAAAGMAAAPVDQVAGGVQP